MAWLADQIQCVFFTVPSTPQMDAAKLWETASNGGSPDGYQRPSSSPTSTSFAHGTLNGYRKVIQSQLGRLDIVISVDPSGFQADMSEPPRISDLSAGFEQLRTAAQNILQKTKIVRLAIVANFSEILETEDAVARRLSEHCRTWFPTPPSDCNYQINVRRRFETTPDFEMNRVLTWSSGVYQIMSTQLAVNSLVSGFPQLQRSLPLVSFKADLNSASAADISQYAGHLFDEMRDEIFLLVEQGIERVHE